MLAMMMCMTALTFSACSDDDDDDKSIDVPEAVTQALKQKYPNATDVDWKQKSSYFVADCWLDGKDPLQPMQYVIEVKQGNQKYQLFYSEDGGLMNTVNVTGKDDTIYPPEE